MCNDTPQRPLRLTGLEKKFANEARLRNNF